MAASWCLPHYEKQATLNKIVPVIECTWHSILQVVSGKEQAVEGLLLSEVLSMEHISLPYGFSFPRMNVSALKVNSWMNSNVLWNMPVSSTMVNYRY